MSIITRDTVLTNAVYHTIKEPTDKVWDLVLRATPFVGETWEDKCDRGLMQLYAILVKEPMGNMACSCHLIDEVNYYTSAHDPAMGPGKIINEQLVHRQEITTKSGNRRVTLTFMPCKNCGECPASIRQITHHVSNLDGDKENTMYIREETVELNSEHFRETGEDPEELLIEDLKRKVNTFIGHWNSIVF